LSHSKQPFFEAHVCSISIKGHVILTGGENLIYFYLFLLFWGLSFDLNCVIKWRTLFNIHLSFD